MSRHICDPQALQTTVVFREIRSREGVRRQNANSRGDLSRGIDFDSGTARFTDVSQSIRIGR
jgi:hypothetical protein